MNKLKTFFHTLKNSSTNPNYGDDILNSRFTFSLKYFSLLMLLFALGFTVAVMFGLSQFKPETITESIVNEYPQELVINYDDKGVTINQELPYSIEWPEEWREGESNELDDLPQKFLVFASDEQITNIRDYYESDALMVVTPTTFYVAQDSNTREVTVYEIPPAGGQDEHFQMSRQVIDEGKRMFLEHPFIKDKLYIPVLGLLFLLLIFPLMWIWHFYTAAFYALVLKIVTSITKKANTVKYKKLLQLCLHTITPVLLLQIVFSLFGAFELNGFLFMIAVVGWSYVMLTKLEEKTTVVHVENQKQIEK